VRTEPTSNVKCLRACCPNRRQRFTRGSPSFVIPSEVEESLILRITSSKRCLDCARHDKDPIWATRPLRSDPECFSTEKLQAFCSELRSSPFALYCPLPTALTAVPCSAFDVRCLLCSLSASTLQRMVCLPWHAVILMKAAALSLDVERSALGVEFLFASTLQRFNALYLCDSMFGVRRSVFDVFFLCLLSALSLDVGRWTLSVRR